MITLKSRSYSLKDFEYLEDVISIGIREKKCNIDCDNCDSTIACADLMRFIRFVKNKINNKE